MFSKTLRFIRSTAFIKIVDPILLFIFVVFIQIPIFILFFIFTAGYIQLSQISLFRYLPSIFSYSIYVLISLIIVFIFLFIFKKIFKLEKNHKPNVLDHIRLCGLIYIILLYFGRIFYPWIEPSDGKAVIPIMFIIIIVLLSSSVVIANILTIFLIRRERRRPTLLQ